MGSIYMKVQADQAGAVRAFLQLTDAEQKAELGLMKIGVAGKRAGKEVQDAGEKGRKAFDVEKLTGYVTGLFSISSAIAAVTGAYKKMADARDAALGGMMESASAVKPLVQLAQTPEDIRRMLGEVQKSRTGAGMPVGDAAGLQFSLESLGLQSYRSQFAQLYGIEDPTAIAEGSRTLIEAMGEQEVGNPLQAVNKIFAASKASKTKASAFAPAATLAGKFFSQIQATDEELLSSLSVLSKGLKDPDIAANQLGQLADVINVKGLGGKGLWAGVQAIQKELEGATPEEQKKYFGRREARLGYLGLLGKKDEIREMERQLGVIGLEAPGEDFMSRMLASYGNEPQLVAERNVRIKREKTKVARESAYGEPEAAEEAAKERIRRKSAEQKEGAIPFAIREAGMAVADFFDLGPKAVAIVGGEREMSDVRKATSKRNRDAIKGIFSKVGSWFGGDDTEGAVQAEQQGNKTTIIKQYGDHFHLNERQGMVKPGEGAPAAGVD